MIERFGQIFTDRYKRVMPDAFVFALVLTLLCAISAMWIMDSSIFEVLQAWYNGFWMLLEFGMQMVLLVVTGYSIALSPWLSKNIDKLAGLFSKPWQVYLFTTALGSLLCLVSWGWIVIAAVLGRELALRVKGVHYPYLIACVYCAFVSWVTGLSSSIPLLLNTPDNFIIEAGILQDTLPTEITLGSGLNLMMMLVLVVATPLIMFFLRPSDASGKEIRHLMSSTTVKRVPGIAEEAAENKLAGKALSDRLNGSTFLQYLIVLGGAVVIIHHFYTKGFDLNLNIMIFIFLMSGMLLHRTPLRYGIAMKRASGNISAIVFQFPFYAGIMGIMMYTGLADKLAGIMASWASTSDFGVLAFVTGGLVNFAIPSAGGEFAVIGPSVLNAVKTLALGLPEAEMTAMIGRASLAIAYGESLSNLMQPFFLLVVLPVMASGIRIQARDIMGYLVLPFLILGALQLGLIYLWPI